MADRRSVWTKRIKDWERSGQTRASFCVARRLNLHTFDYWRRALRASSPPPPLVPVVVAPAPVPAPTAIEVVLTNGIRLQVPPGSDLALLRPLIEALCAC